jgi:hypothetical protein
MYIVSIGTPSITRSGIHSDCRHVARALRDCHMCERNVREMLKRTKAQSE